MSLGDKVKKLREQMGMSQEELAEKLGYKSKTSIYKVEKGMTDLPQSKLIELAEILHTTPAHLIEEDEDETVMTYRIDTKGLNQAQIKEIKKELDNFTAFLLDKLNRKR